MMKDRNERVRYGGRGQIGMPSNSFETPNYSQEIYSDIFEPSSSENVFFWKHEKKGGIGHFYEPYLP